MSTEKNLTNLVINKVESQDVYDYMKANSLINADELYVVAGGDQIATETDDGLMSSEDKIKLDNIEENANNYIHPAYTPRSNGLYKVTIDSTGHVSATTAVTKADITALGIPGEDTNTTYSEATTATSGLMSSSDKTKLDSIPAEKGNYQYLVTDGEGNTMWEDRLGYKAVIKNVVVEKSAAAFQSHMSYKGTYCSERLPFFDSSLSYAIVTVDGVEYELHGSNGIVGNQYLASDSMEDTGEPVCLKMDVDIETSEFGCLIITNLSGSTHDIVISVPEETVVKIPEEYMPYEFVKVEPGKGLSTNDYTTEEKEKLAGVESGANKTTVDSSLSSTSTNPVQNKIINTKFDSIQASIDSKVDKVTGKGLSTNDLTATLKSNYNAAYTHSQQAHAPADAEKNVIVGVQKNGTDLTVNSSTRKVNITVPTKTSELTNDSDFATTTQLDTKVDKVTGKGLSTNDYTTEEKTKLSNIEDGANKTIVDTALSSTSTNPVQNKVINTKLTTMQADIDSKVPSTRTVNGKALSANITLSASDVGALPNTTVIPSIDGLASETYVNNKVAGLVDSAPTTLDTLNELAAALGDDPNFATTVANQIGNKVDKVDGKGLSTNDYTTTEKTKLSGIAEGAQVNQNAFSNVVIGSVTISADNTTDTLALVAGDNVILTPNDTSDSITIAAIDTIYTHPSYTARTGVPTANQSPSFGGTFTVSQPVSDATGHITAINSRTITIPNATATTSTAGLMSASDKSKFDSMNTSAGSVTQPVYFKSGVPTVINPLDSVAFDGYVTKGAESGSTIGASATVEGVNNMASSKQSHAEGGYTRAGNLTLYSESTGMFDSYGYEHAEGYSTLAKKCAAHAEGAHTQAIASMAHAEGLSTIASGGKSHAEGHSTTASGANAHAEGYSTTASGENTHAEGNSTTASFQAAHAEGYGTTASGYAAHAEGYSTIASGTRSHTEGFYTKASSENQHVQGKYNIEDTADTYAHIVGNGTSDTARSNAHTIDWSGNAWFSGDVYVGGTDQSSGVKLATVPTVTSITLSASSWSGSANPYSQVVTISAANANSKIDLQPTAAQIVTLQNQEIQLMVENNNGVCTCYAIGGKPTSDMTMDVLITEVNRV